MPFEMPIIKMSEINKIFFPLFYNSLQITESLSDEEFGRLVRELLKSEGRKEYPANLTPNIILAYHFMLDDAIRIFSLSFTRGARNRSSFADKKNDKTRLGDFDTEDSFQKALTRSYGESK